MKRLLTAPSNNTYVMTGDAEAAELVSAPEFHKAISTLMSQKARFELKHIKHKKFTILTYHLPDYHCLRLKNTDLAGDRSPEMDKIVEDDKSPIIQYLIFYARKIILSFSVGLEKKISLMAYKLAEDGSLRTILVNSIYGYKNIVVNKKVSGQIELFVVEFKESTRFYNITDEGDLEIAYEYQKRRKTRYYTRLLSESMRILRRQNVVSIFEAYNEYEDEGTSKKLRKYQLDKFSL